MNNKKFVEPYNDDYAKMYNHIWPQNPIHKDEANSHIETIKSLLTLNTRWLDAGCGTGYFLSHFSEISRAGFDLSETMIEIAKNANPGALFLDTHDLSKPNSEWNNNWDLVTCTGQPWAYLGSLELIEKSVENLWSWVSSGGKLFLTPLDIQDLFGVEVKYHFTEEEAQSVNSLMNAVISTYNESNEVGHLNLIYPNLDQWVRWLGKFFGKIEIGTWDNVQSYSFPRRYLVCSNKKSKHDNVKPLLSWI